MTRNNFSILLSILTLFLIFALSGCASSENKPVDTKKQDETVQTGTEGPKEETDLKELFEDKLRYLYALRAASADKLSDDVILYTCIYVTEPSYVESVDDRLVYRENQKYSFSDLDKTSNYLFGKSIDFKTAENPEAYWWNSIKQYDIEEGFLIFNSVSKQSTRIKNSKIENLEYSQNSAGNYVVNFDYYKRKIGAVDYYSYYGKYSAVFGGEDEGYVIKTAVQTKAPGTYRNNSDFIGEIVFEGENDKEYSKKLHGFEKARYAVDDRFAVVIYLNSVDDRRKAISSLLEEFGQSPDACYYGMENQCYIIMVNKDQLITTAKKEYVQYVDFFEIETGEIPW